MTKSRPFIYLYKESVISLQSVSMLQLWLMPVKSRRHFTVSWKPPSIAWQHLIKRLCWETSMLWLAESAQHGLVWLDINGVGNSNKNGLLLLLMWHRNKTVHHQHSFQIARQAQMHMDASPFKKLASHWLCHHSTNRHFWNSNHQDEAWSWALNGSSDGVVAALSINQTITQPECC